MKKILFSLVLFFLFILQTFAHPLDISASYFSFNKNYLTVTTYFHSYEVEYLLSKSDIHTKSVYEYYNYKDTIEDYIKKSIRLKSGDEYCTMSSIEMLQMEEYQILSKGVEINYHFECKKDIKKGQLEVYFFDNFALQTNQITIYNLNNKSVSSAPIGASVMNTNYQIYEFDLSQNFKKCSVDTDGDGLSDAQERIYKTDPNKIDTDDDFYTDYEEIFNSWMPLDRHMGPKQTPRMEIPSSILENAKNSIKTQEMCEKEDASLIGKNAQTRGLLSSDFTNNFFTSTLENIGKYVKNKSENGIFYIFLTVVALGFLHALGPGHSKSLLISYILDKKRTFFDGLLYISLFTVTHLIDIVILFLITKVVFTFYDITNYMLSIQRVSLIILFCFSVYMIARAYTNMKNNIGEDPQEKGVKATLLLGFISGLAPCTFGWSIFLLLFSMGSFSLIIPMIIALGMGIFLCLFCIMIATLVLRKKIFEKISLFSRYSSLVSSLILLVLSLFLFFQLF